MTDLAEYAKRAAEKYLPTPTLRDGGDPVLVLHRADFAAGILHLAARLGEVDVIEAGARALYGDKHRLSDWDLGYVTSEESSDAFRQARSALAAMLSKIAEGSDV